MSLVSQPRLDVWKKGFYELRPANKTKRLCQVVFPARDTTCMVCERAHVSIDEGIYLCTYASMPCGKVANNTKANELWANEWWAIAVTARCFEVCWLRLSRMLKYAAVAVCASMTVMPHVHHMP